MISDESSELHGALRIGVIPYLDLALMPKLLGLFAAEHPAIDLSILEISSTNIETLLEEGRMDVGLGWVTRHSPTCVTSIVVMINLPSWWRKITRGQSAARQREPRHQRDCLQQIKGAQKRLDRIDLRHGARTDAVVAEHFTRHPAHHVARPEAWG